MKYCELFGALLDPYVDGELSAEEMERVRSHLAICPGCQAYVDDALAIRAAFPDAEETEIPDGFAEGVCAAARMMPQTKKKAPWLKVLAPLAACLAVVVVLQSGPLSPKLENSARDMAAPEAAMADQPIPEEAPAAPEAFALDNGKPAADSPMDVPAEDVSPAEDAAPSAKTYTDLPFAELTLTAAQAGQALADYPPVSQEAGTLSYHLTAAEYSTLVTALADTGIAFPDIPDTGDTFILVTVTP